MIALLTLSVLGFSFVVFYDKVKRIQQGNLLVIWAMPERNHFLRRTSLRLIEHLRQGAKKVKRTIL